MSHEVIWGMGHAQYMPMFSSESEGDRDTRLPSITSVLESQLRLYMYKWISSFLHFSWFWFLHKHQCHPFSISLLAREQLAVVTRDAEAEHMSWVNIQGELCSFHLMCELKVGERNYILHRGRWSHPSGDILDIISVSLSVRSVSVKCQWSGFITFGVAHEIISFDVEMCR